MDRFFFFSFLFSAEGAGVGDAMMDRLQTLLIADDVMQACNYWYI